MWKTQNSRLVLARSAAKASFYRLFYKEAQKDDTERRCFSEARFGLSGAEPGEIETPLRHNMD